MIARLWRSAPLRLLRSTVQGLFRRAGADLTRLSSVHHPLGRRRRVLRNLGVDLVLDVGANVGQYASELRSAGYNGRIVSIEPLPDAYEKLAARARQDPSWQVMNIALGAHDGELEIRVAGNSVSSSVLEPSAALLKIAPLAKAVAVVTVPVRRLDEIVAPLLVESRRPFLKMDVQGFEAEVLAGAERSISAMVGVQVELALRPMYVGAPSAVEMIHQIEALGFRLAGLEAGLADPETGELAEADGLFVRDEPPPAGSSPSPDL